MKVIRTMQVDFVASYLPAGLMSQVPFIESVTNYYGLPSRAGFVFKGDVTPLNPRAQAVTILPGYVGGSKGKAAPITSIILDGKTRMDQTLTDIIIDYPFTSSIPQGATFAFSGVMKIYDEMIRESNIQLSNEPLNNWNLPTPIARGDGGDAFMTDVHTVCINTEEPYVGALPVGIWMIPETAFYPGIRPVDFIQTHAPLVTYGIVVINMDTPQVSISVPAGQLHAVTYSKSPLTITTPSQDAAAYQSEMLAATKSLAASVEKLSAAPNRFAPNQTETGESTLRQNFTSMGIIGRRLGGAIAILIRYLNDGTEDVLALLPITGVEGIQAMTLNVSCFGTLVPDGEALQSITVLTSAASTAIITADGILGPGGRTHGYGHLAPNDVYTQELKSGQWQVSASATLSAAMIAGSEVLLATINRDIYSENELPPTIVCTGTSFCVE